MKSYIRWVLYFSLATWLGLIAACGSDQSPSDPQKENRTSQRVIEVRPEIPVLKLPEIPSQPIFDYASRSRFSSILREEKQSFDEVITIEFRQERGFLANPRLFNLEKTFLGKKDDGTFLGLYEDDNLEWDTPWETISANMETFRVYGGDNTGKGIAIGYISWDGHTSQLVLQTEFTIDVVNKKIKVMPPQNIPSATEADCGSIVVKAGLCKVYVHVYNALSAIDFRAFGEAGPQIAKDVISFNTVFGLAKSIWIFDPDIDQIRKYYLVPILSAIKDLKALKEHDRKDYPEYIEQTRSAYSNLIYVSIDSALKTQKMIPEAMPTLGASSFGVLQAFIGAHEVGDRVISVNQPPWFEELVAPIIREFGILSVDLVVNGSETPLQDRIDRFISMENEIRESISKICRRSPESQDECLKALQ